MQNFHETVTTTTKVHFKIKKKLFSKGILTSDVCGNHPQVTSLLKFFFFQIDYGDQQPGPFGNPSVFGENPFDDVSRNPLSWMMSDFRFETQGTSRKKYLLLVMTSKHPQKCH